MVWELVTASSARVFLPEHISTFDLTQSIPLLFLESVHLYFSPGYLMGLDQTEMETFFFFLFSTDITLVQIKSSWSDCN